ncbi:MAG TPA: hypothetical protein VMZ71_10875 [Gemmataceae bacterium]|nr:hypothetical protein [Gemmataceae bacterium]
MKTTPQPEITPPECGPTVERLQAALDAGDVRELPADPHALVCATCRGRIRAARLLLAALANPEPVALPPNFADRVLADVRPATRSRNWRVVVAGAMGLAAAVLVAVWTTGKLTPPSDELKLIELVGHVPAPTAPPPKPLRISDEIARAGQAILDTARPITEPASTAPRMFASLSNPFVMAAPPAVDLEPARRSLADIPDAARAGFEPIAGSASKALARLVRDVSAVQPGKPKS